jgi:hypothetical protein
MTLESAGAEPALSDGLTRRPDVHSLLLSRPLPLAAARPPLQHAVSAAMDRAPQ